MEMAKSMAEVNEVAALYESRFKPEKLKFLEEVSCSIAVADPGFPVGGGGAPTSNVGTFQPKHMRKQKNWILLGGTHQWRPLDPPMVLYGGIDFSWFH